MIWDKGRSEKGLQAERSTFRERARMQQSPGSQVQPSVTVLDLKGLKEPDNILAVLKKVSELQNGPTLEFVIGSNPFQLYDLLQQRGYILEMQPQKDGTFLGKVTPRGKNGLEH